MHTDSYLFIYFMSVINLYQERQRVHLIFGPQISQLNNGKQNMSNGNICYKVCFDWNLIYFLFHILWIVTQFLGVTYVWWKDAILDTESSLIQCKIQVPIIFISKTRKHSELHNKFTSVFRIMLWKPTYLIQFSSVTQSCTILCDPMDYSMPSFPVLHQLPELTQTHVHQVSDAIKPFHPLLSASPSAFNLF